MPPRISAALVANCARTPRCVTPTVSRLSLTRLPIRTFADSEKPPPQKQQTGPNQDVAPHVSEEAAKMGEITGEGGPELEQGTPVQDVLKRDKASQEKAPKVMKESLQSTNQSKGNSRSYSTMATSPIAAEANPPGHIFELPELPIPGGLNIKKRDDPLVEQVTNLIMQHGKLSVAERNMSMILAHLNTASPPSINPSRPLLPGAPPPSHLPLNPIQYLTLAIDSVAPLMRMRSQKGAAGGGVALQIPIPLRLRQRRRKAIMWILDAIEKKPSRGSGRGQFAHRFAEEIIGIVEGRSSVWEKRNGVHKMGVSARANMGYSSRR